MLAADIGGTHARFLYAPAGSQPADVEPLVLDTAGYLSMEPLIADALQGFGVQRVAGTDAMLAVAGPVNAGRAQFTNLSLSVDAQILQRHFGFRRVRLINDLEAAARSVAEQPPERTTLLRHGPATGGRCLLLSVGTGLGTAYWSRAKDGLNIEPAEAGHVGFAPTEPWEAEFLRMLQTRYGERVSWERVLSGNGIAMLEAFARGGDPLAPAEVTHRAISGNGAALDALRRFSRLLGTFAGDLVLAAPAWGGVWLTGGVLARLGTLFDTKTFLDGFDAKGRLSPLLESVPVNRIDDDNLGVRGALLAARSTAGV